MTKSYGWKQIFFIHEFHHPYAPACICKYALSSLAPLLHVYQLHAKFIKLVCGEREREREDEVVWVYVVNGERYYGFIKQVLPNDSQIDLNSRWHSMMKFEIPVISFTAFTFFFFLPLLFSSLRSENYTCLLHYACGVDAVTRVREKLKSLCCGVGKTFPSPHYKWWAGNN